MTQKILLTGGSGYIGSHTTLALLQQGIEVVVLDNLSNSSPHSLQRIEALTGCRPIFVEGDIRDASLLSELFTRHAFSAVMHFAGLKAVGESTRAPLDYYEHNVSGTLTLCRAMSAAEVHTLVFSSSATVYGTTTNSALKESDPVGAPSNPYGRTKLIIEQLLSDLAASDRRWRVAVLRYFNPVGAHESGLMGEDPRGVPSNLAPYIAQVAVGRQTQLEVFGDDYPTTDGTGVRDYIHVMDLAAGHVQALSTISNRHGVHIWNLGTGKGYSVLEVVRAFEEASGRRIPYRVTARRPGDVAVSFADPSKAEQDLAWKAKRGLSEMMRDMWCWQQANPEGYSD